MEHVPFTWRHRKAALTAFLRFFYRKIIEKADQHYIISNQRILAKKIDNNKRIRKFVHFKVYFNIAKNFAKKLKFEVTVSNQKLMNAH